MAIIEGSNLQIALFESILMLPEGCSGRNAASGQFKRIAKE